MYHKQFTDFIKTIQLRTLPYVYYDAEDVYRVVHLTTVVVVL